MEMKSVYSSNIFKIGYDEKTKTLRVEFLNGSQYDYANVSKEEHEALMESDSKGSYLHKRIRPYKTSTRV